MFTPFGNMMRLPDGRVLVKNKNGVWIDQMTGSQYNPQTMRDMMYSANFDVPDGGRGKKTPYFVIGIGGAFTITNWLNDVKSGIDSLDMVFIGDSNTAFSSGDAYLAQGLADNFLLAGICSGMINYGSPVHSIGGDAVQPYNNLGYWNYNNGWRTNANRGWTNGNRFGPNEYKNQYGVSLGTFSQSAIKGLSWAGYAWLPDGTTGVSDLGASWYLGNTGGKTGLNAGLSLTVRFIAGTTGNTGGTIRILGYDAASNRFVGDNAADNYRITFTGGFTAHEHNITKSGGLGNTAVNYYFGGLETQFPGFCATGPIAFASYSVYNPVKGLATHSLQNQPGYSLGAIYQDLTLAGISGGNYTVQNYLKEYYNRQKKAGGSGRVCIVINGGINTDTTTTDASTYMINIKNYVKSEWAAAGLPSDKLAFLGFHTWEGWQNTTWNTALPTVITSTMNHAKGTSDFTYAGILTFGGTSTGLTAAGYYNTNDQTHLSLAGYKYVSQNIMDALLKQRNTNRYS